MKTLTLTFVGWEKGVEISRVLPRLCEIIVLLNSFILVRIHMAFTTKKLHHHPR